MPEPVLELESLGHRYGEFEALRGLSLSLHPGECLALIGHNGSGKTTAVRMIAGLLEISSGEIRVAGAGVGEQAARAATAVVLDTPALYDDLTVVEHLELVALAHGVVGDELDDRAADLLVRLELASKADSRPTSLSRGMRQKVSLACALVRPFSLLVLDEPVVGLDPASQRTLRELIAEAVADGAAVLLTTHQLEFARGIAGRAVMLADGEVVVDGPYDEVIDGELVRGRGLV
ncbi:MAG TPA: ABC transporter ATP-binding protein [Solirubrobacteraceae bacterium]|nr:ABC transporter ATP-binding protein [Solirubrobacteraceae bacterium]